MIGFLNEQKDGLKVSLSLSKKTEKNDMAMFAKTLLHMKKEQKCRSRLLSVIGI